MPENNQLGDLNARIAAALEGLPAPSQVPVADTRRARDEGRSIFGPLSVSGHATDEILDTAAGPIPVRVFRPNGDPSGVYLHFHGGGWALGATHHQDSRLERLMTATQQVVVSVDYRLAPEHPYPAGPDDCEAAAVAVIGSSQPRFGATAVTLGGESAGAHLAVTTALRLRDRHGYRDLRAANLLYGIYDLRLTPSARHYGSRPQVLNTESMRWFIEQFVGSADVEHPDVSPLMADLEGMPPAIFTVGTNDPLLDDTLFLHQRWRSAGHETLLQEFSDAPHAFDAFDVDISTVALDRVHAFLSTWLAGR
jgi:acetyl esterase/lipase